MTKRLISLILLFALTTVSLAAFPTSYQPQRERKVNSAPIAQATPPPAASPTPAASPAPVSESTPTASRTASTTRTLADLQTRIAEILRKPELAPAMVAVKIVSLDTGRVLFEENAHKLMRPASNMKLYTVATALDRLSPDFRFNTSVYAFAKPDAAGVVRGGLTIYGRGDPSIAARFNNGDYLKGIDDLAARIAAAGVKRVEGDLVGDESYFTGPQYGSGWEWEDLTWYYGAEVSALTVNDNALDLFVKPGARIGAAASVTTGPADPLLTIINRVTTGARAVKREISVYRGLGQNTIEVSGVIPVDDRGYTGGVAITDPALLFVHLLRASLAKQGIMVTGRLRTERVHSPRWVSANSEGQHVRHSTIVPLRPNVEIASMQSPPLSVIAAQTLKPSQNLYTELILRTLGKTPENSPVLSNARTSEDQGLEVVKGFLKEAGLTPESLNLSDGSGLSRNDMVSADATVQLLTFMSKHKYAAIWRDALPIAGGDCTMRNRKKCTTAENNVRAKTGSLSSASSLSGYVTSAASENLVFSIMVYNYQRDAEPRSDCIDPIAVLLASFA